MGHASFSDFETTARSEGYDEILERNWAANAVVGTHAHPFAVKALVVAGEFWLTEGELTRHLVPGDRFELAPSVPHAERYGAEGATFWTARRHPKA